MLCPRTAARAKLCMCVCVCVCVCVVCVYVCEMYVFKKGKASTCTEQAANSRHSWSAQDSTFQEVLLLACALKSLNARAKTPAKPTSRCRNRKQFSCLRRRFDLRSWGAGGVFSAHFALFSSSSSGCINNASLWDVNLGTDM